MVMNGEKGVVCEVVLNGVRLEHVLEFKCFGCVLDESGIDWQSVVGRWRLGGELQVPLGP